MYLNTDTKYSILYLKYVFCILNAKYIPSLQYTWLLVPRKGMLTPL